MIARLASSSDFETSIAASRAGEPICSTRRPAQRVVEASVRRSTDNTSAAPAIVSNRRARGLSPGTLTMEERPRRHADRQGRNANSPSLARRASRLKVSHGFGCSVHRVPDRSAQRCKISGLSSAAGTSMDGLGLKRGGGPHRGACRLTPRFPRGPASRRPANAARTIGPSGR